MEILFIIFCIMSMLAVGGSVALYLVKSKKLQDGIFYGMALFGMFIAVMNATSSPVNYMMEIIIAWGFGILAIIGIMVKFRSRNQENLLSKHLVFASVFLGMVDLLFFI